MKTKMLRLVSFLLPLAVASSAFAQEAAPAGTNANDVRMWAYFAAFLGLGLAAFGGALGQSKAAAAALEGIARNPNASDKVFTPMIIGLALIESLVIYSLVVALVVLFAPPF